MHHVQRNSRSVVGPTQDIYRLMSGFWIAQAVHVAAKLGIADLLEGGPQTSASLAQATATHERSLYRLLRALASVGIFAEQLGGRFVLTPSAECLRTATPESLRAYAVMMGGQWVWRSCGEMLHSVRTGQAGFEYVFGAPEFEYYTRNPETGRIAAAGLTSRSALENMAVTSAYDFGDAGIVVDVGGGQGTLLRAILRAHPRTTGVLFDMFDVVNSSRALFDEEGLESRCTLQAGNFFAEMPPEGDVYIFKKIIHDWNDERACLILQNCRKVIPDRSRILLVEMLITAENEFSLATMLDLLMLVYTGGQERTEAEYRNLLAFSGFQLRRVIPTASAVSILEAVPV
jgi:hypothetical protein